MKQYDKTLLSFEIIDHTLDGQKCRIEEIILRKRDKQRKNRDKQEKYGSEGMALGMCLGVAVSTAVHIYVGIGRIAGMVLGGGSNIEKKSDKG